MMLGVNPVHSAARPSCLTMTPYAPTALGYFFGVPGASFPSACMRTLTKSVGDATIIPIPPVVSPAAIFRCKGTSPTCSSPT